MLLKFKKFLNFYFCTLQEKVIFVTCEDDDKIADIQKLNGKCVRYFIQASLGLESILCFLISKTS